MRVIGLGDDCLKSPRLVAASRDGNLEMHGEGLHAGDQACTAMRVLAAPARNREADDMRIGKNGFLVADQPTVLGPHLLYDVQHWFAALCL